MLRRLDNEQNVVIGRVGRAVGQCGTACDGRTCWIMAIVDIGAAIAATHATTGATIKYETHIIAWIAVTGRWSVWEVIRRKWLF